MSTASDSRVRKLLLDAVPTDGESVGNAKLRELFDAAVELKSYKVGAAEFEKARDALIAEGVLLRGNAKGGFGAWCWDVAFQPAQIQDILAKHGR